MSHKFLIKRHLIVVFALDVLDPLRFLLFLPVDICSLGLPRKLKQVIFFQFVVLIRERVDWYIT